MLYVIGNLNPESQEFLEEALKTNGVEYRLCSYNPSPLTKAFIVQQIMDVKPTAVMCLGTRVLGMFAELREDTMHWARNDRFKIGPFPMYCTYSPNFFTQRGGVRAKEYLVFANDLKNAYELNKSDYEEKTAPVRLFTQDGYVDFMRMFAQSKYRVEDLKSRLSKMSDEERAGYPNLTRLLNTECRSSTV